jgi:hypothetical protein
MTFKCAINQSYWKHDIANVQITAEQPGVT